MSLFAAGFVEVIILLIIVFGSLIKGIAEYYAEQRKKNLEQKSRKATEKIFQAGEEKEEPVLAEALEILYDLEEMDAVPVKSKKPPKIRSKSSRKKSVEVEPISVAQPVLAAAMEQVEPPPMPTGTNRPQPSPLAVGLVKMFQSPTGIQQAVLASEILKRRF